MTWGRRTAKRPPDSRSSRWSGTTLSRAPCSGVGLIAILWTASAYIGCFFRASATIWGVERRPVWRAWPLRMALTMAFLMLLALALLMIVLTGQLASSIGDALGIEEGVARPLRLPQVARAAGRGAAAHRAALPRFAEPRAVRHALAGADAGGRHRDGSVAARLGRVRRLRERVRHLRHHVRRAGHDDRGTRLAVAHEPHAADGSRAGRGARVPEGRSRLARPPAP